MAAAADHTYSKGSLADTFLLSNCCPQSASLNRGVWAKLERCVRELSREHGRVRIVTGPAYIPIEVGEEKRVSYRVIGKNNVAVPTHFFKYISFNRGGEAVNKAFLIPNTQQEDFLDFDSYEVSVEYLEFLTGLILNRGRGVKKYNGKV